ncbi:alpha/beta fold hydrolase [Methylocystis parvus]|uniref:Alpha/beta hydrolase n=1 Tax=Methylocystis parvus TaxID=134 RepID=A0A6B8M2R9_9HYPH|nr:alpha/beta hydrolase [Methylocystis parvus]QGM97181.1 alpha/beta hydrolase [Methylocystis parvus]WBJ98915.1 alpha/beta hydrolase [Methylocystis parvus OBBP]
MSESADLFPGFASHWIDAPAGKIFARSHGAGPAVLLLHGFGQTHVAWRKVAPKLAERFTVVVMDLRGYGWSAAPESEKGEAYAKREMAGDVVRVMEALGHVQFALVGHDRGARVGFRLALDHPGRLTRLALINIAPVDDNFGASDLWRVGRARFLSMDAPQPEELVALDPADFLNDALKDSSKDKSLDVFGPQALAAYHAAFNDPTRIHAFCEDYRAGATIDKEALAADKAADKKLLVPTLILYGETTFPSLGGALRGAWKEWGDDVTSVAIDSGLYAMEEAPEATLRALDPFLR